MLDAQQYSFDEGIRLLGMVADRNPLGSRHDPAFSL